jgi:hypothetical protein
MGHLPEQEPKAPSNTPSNERYQVIERETEAQQEKIAAWVVVSLCPALQKTKKAGFYSGLSDTLMRT